MNNLQTADRSTIAAADPDAVAKIAELAIIIPTFNERDNIALLVERIEATLPGVSWEAIFVDDDSADGTAERVRELAQRDPRVRCVQRLGRRGLSSAVVEGMLATSAPYLAVMDADLQHDETLLPRMFAALKEEGLDIVVGSRFVEGSEVAGLSDTRVGVSRFAIKLSRLIIKSEIKDPMSGFFMMPRATFESVMRGLSAQGFKILLDIFATAKRPLRFRELSFHFGKRQHGESKLDTMVAWEYAMLILDKLVGRWLPARFVLFAAIGGFGLIVHLVTLGVGLNLVGLGFPVAQTVATLVAMTGNFFLNNVFTYRDQRLRGIRLLWGLVSFYLICAVGAVANVGIATLVFEQDTPWWGAGIAGAVVGAVWNYAVSSVFTWRTHRK